MGTAAQPSAGDTLASPPISLTRSKPWRPAIDWLDREAFVIVYLAIGFAAEARLIRTAIVSDAWYTLLAGRVVATSGLPHVNTLTVIDAGGRWVDQQWLCHLVYYELWRAGGWPLALLATIGFFAGSFALVAFEARRIGASDRSVALVGLFCFAVGAANGALRAQIPAYVLFAVVLLLLLADERAPSRRVFLVFPLLALWANVHGSVVLGAGLVALRGGLGVVGELRSPLRLRAMSVRNGLLIVAPWACVFASPYASELPHYYRTILDNPTLQNTVSEWQAGTVHNEPLFFALLVVAVCLAFGGRKALSPFGLLALLLTALAGLLALRDAVWFTLVAGAVLPSALDAVWRPTSRTRRRRINVSLSAAALVTALAFAAATATHGRAWFERSYPSAAVQAVRRATDEQRHALVFADERYADWLLFDDPPLAGRVAYDIRFEILTSAELETVDRFRTEQGVGWIHAADGYSLFVLDPSSDGGALSLLERRPGSSVLFQSKDVVVLRSPRPHSRLSR